MDGEIRSFRIVKRPLGSSPVSSIYHLLSRCGMDFSIPFQAKQGNQLSSRLEAGKTGLFLTCGGKLSIHLMWERVFGASLRPSAHGKSHEEGGSIYTKAGSSLRSPPGNSRASTPKTSLPTLLLCALTYTSDFTRAVPHHLFWRRR